MISLGGTGRYCIAVAKKNLIAMCSFMFSICPCGMQLLFAQGYVCTSWGIRSSRFWYSVASITFAIKLCSVSLQLSVLPDVELERYPYTRRMHS